MPVHNKIPYFEHLTDIECPDSLHVPFDDVSAFPLYPDHQHVYNKMFVAASQGIRCAPHQIEPDAWPVFEKPIHNLFGMSTGSGKVCGPEEYKPKPGYMWMELLEGEHISTDVVVWRGEPLWFGHVRGEPDDNGKFKWWEAVGDRPWIDAYVAGWIRDHLDDYTGLLNVETLGCHIIEAHLRISPSSLPMYGPRWLDTVITCLETGLWAGEVQRPEGYAIPVFTDEYKPHEVNPKIHYLRDLHVVPTLDAGMPDEGNPPDGHRKALIFSEDLVYGLSARSMVDRWVYAFQSTPL